MKQRPISEKLFTRAKEIIPGGVNSPVRSFRSVDGGPLFIKRGIGPYVEDVDGNRHIDFCGSWGPLIHGHAHPRIVGAISESLGNGTSFGAPHEGEIRIAEIITGNIPWVEMIRFVSSGTEAVMSAIRLARAHTNRNVILKFDSCYHGHVDSLLVNAGSGLLTFGTSSSAGVTSDFVNNTLIAELDDEAGLETVFQKYGHLIAGAIVEPVPANSGLLLQRRSFLQKLRDLTKQHGSVLIFDEVISGFRVGFQGAAGMYKIIPDLVTYGKIIGGGLPVGAFGGAKRIMEMLSPLGPVYQAGTLSGNPASLAAGIASLSLCLEDGFFEHLAQTTKHNFIQPLARKIVKKSYPVKLPYLGSVFWFLFHRGPVPRTQKGVTSEGTAQFGKFHRLALDRGVYLSPSHYEVGFVSSVHNESVLNEASQALGDALDEFFTKH